jgi:lipopolysaccharide/colanic/teichoic acid biosynthesis glycosyltransferase
MADLQQPLYLPDLTLVRTTVWEQYPTSPVARQDRPYLWMKRVLDISIAGLTMILLLPLLILVAFLIVLDSPGPALFIQERMGYDACHRKQKSFRMLKFRSMYSNSDQSVHQKLVAELVNNPDRSVEHGTLVKLSNDERVTRVGRILRRTSLDEIPQLWNVLRGEMSLVGPRPVPLYEVAEYGARHMRRLGAVPGITCLWQVELRGQSGIEDMVRLDVQYIEQQSIWLDVRILLSTVSVVVSGHGAV